MEPSTKTKKITIAVTPQVHRAIVELHRRGLHGFSIADVARRLVDDGVRRAFVVGELAEHTKRRGR